MGPSRRRGLSRGTSGDSRGASDWTVKRQAANAVSALVGKAYEAHILRIEPREHGGAVILVEFTPRPLETTLKIKLGEETVEIPLPPGIAGDIPLTIRCCPWMALRAGMHRHSAISHLYDIRAMIASKSRRGDLDERSTRGAVQRSV